MASPGDARLSWWGRLGGSLFLAEVLAILLAVAALGVTGAVVYLEGHYAKPRFDGPEAAFKERSIGTEFAPLAVLKVLPAIFPRHFEPDKAKGVDWIDQFGFIRRDDPDGLPVGFTRSNYQPASASPSPVTFVGLSCAACHSLQIRDVDKTKTHEVIFGTGNTAIDLSPFFEAFRTAILLREPNEKGRKKVKPTSPFNRDAVDLEESDTDYVLTIERVEQELKDRDQTTLSWIDRNFIGLWLGSTRSALIKTLPKYDYPYWGAEGPYNAVEDGRKAEFNRDGPGRTQPFKTLSNAILNLPVTANSGYSKIPAVFHEDLHLWAQFDGSIKNHVARSALAAMTAGATPDSLDQPEQSHNITAAADYTSTLVGKTFLEYFPKERANYIAEKAGRGAKVYRDHCAQCHGTPGATPGSWEFDPKSYSADGGRFDPADQGPQHGRVVPVDLLKTDPARVNFRYADILPFQLYRRFTFKTEIGHPYEEKGGYPLVHSLAFDRSEIRSTGGYVNAPIDSTFARAPYLHNASVLTLAELINLQPRRKVFYRGKNAFDTRNVGLLSPDRPDADHYYVFDTTLPGNSNAGHDYPWRSDDPRWDKKALEDLLEYLKTF